MKALKNNQTYSKTILLFLLLAWVLSACTPKEKDKTPSTQDTPQSQKTPAIPTATPIPTPTLTPTRSSFLELEPASLTGTKIKFLHPWVGDTAKAMRAVVSEFNRYNKWGITVEVATSGGEEALYDQARQLLTSGDMPDVVAIHPYYAQRLDGDYFWTDISPYLTDAEWGLTAAELQDIPPVFFEQSRLGDRLLGLPIGISATVLYYNMTWAVELGFEQAPTTPDELKQQACDASDALLQDNDFDNNQTGGIPMYITSENIISWYTAFGGTVPQETPVKIFNNQSTSDAFEFIKSMYAESCVWDPNQPLPYDYFAKRYAVMVPGNIDEFESFKGAIERSGSKDEWAMIPFPTLDGEGTFLVDGSALVITVSKPEQQLASWIFTRWLSTSAAQQVISKASYLFPPQISDIESMDDTAQRAPQWNELAGLLDLAQAAPAYPNWVIDRVLLEDAFFQYFYGYQPDLARVLTILDETILEFGEAVDVP